MTVAPNLLTGALPLTIRPKSRGSPSLKNLDADELPLIGLDEIGVSAFLSEWEKRQRILGAGAEHSPEEAAIAFFKFQIYLDINQQQQNQERSLSRPRVSLCYANENAPTTTAQPRRLADMSRPSLPGSCHLEAMSTMPPPRAN